MKKISPFWNGRVVIITGSARGIGKKTAELLLLTGAKVLINARSADNLRACEQSWKSSPQFSGFPFQDRLLAVSADVSTAAGAALVVSKTLQSFGKIDVLINNAGLSMRGSIQDLVPDVVRGIFSSNFDSAFFMTQAALPALKTSRGRVLFVSSQAGLRGFAGVSVYSAAKAAVQVFQQSLEAESPEVHSGVIYLGFTENDQDKTIYAASGELIRHERRWQITQEQAAQSILRAIQTKKHRTILTIQGRLLDFFNTHFSRLVALLLNRSKGKIHAIKKKG